MKIAFLITRADSIGGAQVYVRNLAERYNASGNEVHVIAGTEGKLKDWCTDNNISFRRLRYLKHPINPVYDLLSVFELAKVLKKINPDIVSISSSKAGIIGRLACSLVGIPAVLTVHGWSFTEGIGRLRKGVFGLIERSLKKFTKKVIVISEFDRQLALKERVLPESCIQLIYNGVHSSNGSEVTRKLPGKELILVMVARHDKPKDHAGLFQALRDLPRVRLLLVGDGPLLDQNRELAKRMDIEDRVEFLGFQKNVTDILNRAHVFVLISEYEGFPLSTIEAMAAGLPVIVSDVCGAGEAVEEGRNGFKIRKGDIPGLKAAITFFYENPGKIMEMGARSHSLYREKFSFEPMFEKTDRLFRQVIASGG